MVLACVRGLVVAVLMASIILAVLACFIGRDDSLINNNPVLLRHGRRLVQAVDARGRIANGTGPRHV